MRKQYLHYVQYKEFKIKTKRQKQAENLLKKDIDEIIRREISDPKIGFFTITYARISRDFKNATVGVSVIGNKDVQEETFEAIKHASGYIHHKLSRRSVMKYTPELKFEYDDMPEVRVEEILKNIEMEENEKNKDTD